MKGLVNEKQPTEESNDPVGDYMNYNKSKYRRRNYEPELKNQPKELEGGPYYIRIDGKIFKDRDGKPVMFNGKKHANAVALKMMQKDFNKGKVFTLSIKPEDKQDGIDEELDEGLIDKAVVGAAKYAVPAITRSLPAIAKAGAKAGGKLGTRAGVAVAKKIGTSAMSAGRLGKELGAVAGQYAAGAGATAAAKRLAAVAAARKEPKLVNSPDDIIDEAKYSGRNAEAEQLKHQGYPDSSVYAAKSDYHLGQARKFLNKNPQKHQMHLQKHLSYLEKMKGSSEEVEQIDEMTPERKRALMTALDKIDAHKDYLHGKYGVNKPGEKTPPDRRETLLALRKAATDYRQATKADKESRKIQEGTMTQGIFDKDPRKAKMALQGLNNLLRDALPASQAADILHRYVYDDELLDLIDALALRKHDADIRTDRDIMDRIEYLRNEAGNEGSSENLTEESGYVTVDGLVRQFYYDNNIPSKKRYLDIKHPGIRVWTRGDGTRYREPGRIGEYDSNGNGKLVQKFWDWLIQQPSVKPIGKISGEFGSSNFDDAYAYRGLYFARNRYGIITWGSTSRLRNSTIWRQQKESVVGEKQMNEQSQAGSLDPETALRQARNITKAIKYDNALMDIIVKIQTLAEQVPGLDQETLKYSIDNVHEAQSALESAVYGLEEAFEDLLTNAQNSEEGLDEAKQRLDAKCWSGYKKQGTKMKGGVRVNNCVPAKESAILKGLKK